VCVVLASGGYPGDYVSGKEIEIDGDRDRDREGEREVEKGIVVFHAGTKRQEGRLVTAGGRVLAVTSTAPTLSQARAQVYAAVERIRFDGRHYRKDIAQ
jgi:phosphoribosylamine--glycine ligase